MIISFELINKTKTTNKRNNKSKRVEQKMKLANLLAYELIPTNDTNIVEFDDILS